LIFLHGATIETLAFQANPFDEALPTSIGGYTFNLRSPGQYVDVEAGLNYNVSRNYEPAAGRYTRSDPLGLAAGPSSYGNPLSYVDPLGVTGFHLGHRSTTGLGGGGFL
jgi:RHS repeat-associated protein